MTTKIKRLAQLLPFDPRLSLLNDHMHTDIASNLPWLRQTIVDVKQRICERQIPTTQFIWSRGAGAQ